jgi:hypothetical protein
MTGVKPPDALTRAAALVNGQPDPLMPANEVNSSVPAQTSEVLQKAMAQNRDQRYASAAEMRKVLQGIGSETTVSNRTEADTVLFPSPPAIANETRASVPQTAVQTGETTVVRPPGESRRKPWVIAAAAVVLLGGVVGVFYAYQNRNNPANVEAPAANQSDTPAVQSDPSGGESAPPTATSKEPKQVTDEKRQVAADEKAVRRQENDTKQRVTDRQQADRNAAEDADRARAERESRARPEEPETPDENAVDPPRPRPPGRRRAGNVVIRNLPDGTQVISGPGGNRVIVSPDGSSQVIRPGQRVNRRRNQRRPYKS